MRTRRITHAELIWLYLVLNGRRQEEFLSARTQAPVSRASEPVPPRAMRFFSFKISARASEAAGNQVQWRLGWRSKLAAHACTIRAYARLRGAAYVKKPASREEAHVTVTLSRQPRVGILYPSACIYFFAYKLHRRATRSFLLTPTIRRLSNVCTFCNCECKGVSSMCLLCAKSHFLLLNLFLAAGQCYIVTTELLDNINKFSGWGKRSARVYTPSLLSRDLRGWTRIETL